jgi:hypothetical protein
VRVTQSVARGHRVSGVEVRRVVGPHRRGEPALASDSAARNPATPLPMTRKSARKPTVLSYQP